MKTDPRVLAVLAGVGAALVAVWAVKRAGSAVLESGALDPADSRNLAYSGVNGIGRVLTGDASWTLGGGIYDFFHDVPADQPGAVGVDLNPADDRNLANRGVTAVGQWASGDASWTLGGWIYDVTH